MLNLIWWVLLLFPLQSYTNVHYIQSTFILIESRLIGLTIGSGGLIGINFIFVPNNLLVIFYFIASLAETNRIPPDLPESESESIAGFITEYSSIYYSIIVLTEYTNIIALTLFMIIIFSLGY